VGINLDKKDKLWIMLMQLGSFGCHQLPERSFSFKNYQFPICARCTGVLVGQIAMIIQLVIFTIPINIFLCMLLLGIMFLDWFVQFLKIKESNNKRRLLTGFLAGYGLIGGYWWVFENIYKFI
jgi:uncharacterized membrane protein